MVTFIETDLLADISQKELDGLAKKLVDAGDPEPIATTIAEQQQKVDLYTRRYDLPGNDEKRLVRALVLYELYARLASIPPKRDAKHQEAMKELRDIRDGKFPDLAQEEPLPEGIPSGEGRFGSAPKISTSRYGS